VDVEAISGGGYNIGYVLAEEWTEYTVNVPATGNYIIDCRVANLSAGGSMHIEFGGVNKSGAITVPNTGSWATYQTVTISNVALSAGQQVMRVAFDAVSGSGSVVNLDYLNIKSATTGIGRLATANGAGMPVIVGPNPMRERVTFSLPENAGANAQVEIYGRDGHAVYTQTVETCHGISLQWDGADMTGHPAPPGVYFYTVIMDGRQETGRIIVLPPATTR
jgi:hypothetical protein